MLKTNCIFFQRRSYFCTMAIIPIGNDTVLTKLFAGI